MKEKGRAFEDGQECPLRVSPDIAKILGSKRLRPPK
jgi:hypothetical protein